MHGAKKRAFMFVAVVALATACAAPHAQQVRKAQDALSAGAAIETRVRFSDTASLASVTDSPDPHYADAVRLIDDALKDSKEALQADSLYGTALTVQAVASWRLGKTTEANAAALKVVTLADAEGSSKAVFPRDEALCRALPTLILIDALGRSVAKIDRADVPGSLAKLVAILDAGAKYRAALAKVAELPIIAGHPFQVYLAQSQCEVAFVMKRALGSVRQSRVTNDHRAPYNAARDAALKHLAETAGPATVRHYEGILPKLTLARDP